MELGICKEAPSLENAYLVKGYEYVSIITTKIDRPLLEKFREFGVEDDIDKDSRIRSH